MARRAVAARHPGIDLLIDVRRYDNREALIEMDIENRVRADIGPYERGRSHCRWLGSGHFRNQSAPIFLTVHMWLSMVRDSRHGFWHSLPRYVWSERCAA